mgnify:CR=1 FL=1
MVHSSTDLEQVRVPQEKRPKVEGHLAGRQVEKHVPPPALERHADRQLVGEEPRRFLRAGAEGEMRIPVVPQVLSRASRK